jgi:hypothetical protein
MPSVIRTIWRGLRRTAVVIVNVLGTMTNNGVSSGNRDLTVMMTPREEHRP